MAKEKFRGAMIVLGCIGMALAAPLAHGQESQDARDFAKEKTDAFSSFISSETLPRPNVDFDRLETDQDLLTARVEYMKYANTLLELADHNYAVINDVHGVCVNWEIGDCGALLKAARLLRSGYQDSCHAQVLFFNKAVVVKKWAQRVDFIPADLCWPVRTN